MAYALAKVRRLTGDFFSWWIDELRALIPGRLLSVLAPPVKELVLDVRGQQLLLSRRIGASEQALGAISLSEHNADADRAQLRALLEGIDLTQTRVCLQMSAQGALRKVIDLPLAAEENLAEVMAFEMDRLTPFSSDAVHYDVRILSRDSDSKRIKAELMVLPRMAVDPTLQRVQRLGLFPDVLAVPRRGTAEGGGDWRLSLARPGSGGRRWWFSAPVLLVVLAALLLSGGIRIGLDRLQRQAETLDREVAAARKEAEEGRRLQEEIEKLSGEGDFIVERKRARPPVVEVLNELSRVLPDDTWLYRLRLLSEELQVFGYSPNASAMIGLLESAPLFSSAQFRAPLTRDQRVEAEQFHVAFRVAREGRP